MHNDVKPFKQNPSHKFCKNLINFENPKKIQKPQKLGKKCMKCMINRWKKDHTCENTRKRPKKEWGRWRSWNWGVWERERHFIVKRDWGEMTEIHADLLYRKP